MTPLRIPQTSHVLSAAFAALLFAAPAAAQQEAPPTRSVDYTYDTGPIANEGAAPAVIVSFEVHDEGGRSMRLYFEEIELAGDLLAGTGSILRVTSHADGHVQELNAMHVRQWQSSTAYFNGDTVQVEVVAHPGTGTNRLRMRSLEVGLPWPQPETQCGPIDDRVLSSDARVSRVLPIGCTAWLIDDCHQCFLTAGHCSGGLSVAQFNVPQSNPDGSTNNPGPDDQYPIDGNSLQTNGGQGVGNDWAYFGAFANSGTGLTPAEAQGATFILAPPPSPGGNVIRITGHGTDSTPPTSNAVQQTHTGPMVTGTVTTVQYQTDTTGGNSGSPVIWEATGEAVGIHTHGGCSTDGSGQNSGTSSSHPDLQAALADPQGICGGGISVGVIPSQIQVNQPTTFVVDALGSVVPNTTMLHYRFQGGAFTSIPMADIGGDMFSADLPAASCDDVPEFYFSSEDADCGLMTIPANAPSGFFSTLVVSGTPTFADNFETNMGWTTSATGPTTSGFWQRGVPINDPGWAYDPQTDADGSGRCYLTQNTAGNSDVDNGRVRLISPPLDLTTSPDLGFRYDYYLRLSDDSGADWMRVQVSETGDDGTWQTVAQHDTDGAGLWRSNIVSVDDITATGLTLNDQMRVRFVAFDSDPQTFVEAGVDAFQVRELTCSDELGTRFCSPNVPNSTGVGGTMSLAGSPVVSDDDLTLIATQLPPESNIGYFIMGMGTNSFTPPGSAGMICVAPGIVRFLPPVNNTNELPGGFSRTVGTSGPDSGNITVGSTWSFQAWHRDSMAATSNLTDAVGVTFQ